MGVMMIEAKVKDECVGEVEASAKAMFAALDRDRPQGVRYASSRLGDGTTFVILLALEDGLGPDNPLGAVPEFREFQQGLPGWLAEPATPQPLEVVGSYNLF
jgi:hypothetical protein